MYSKHKLLMIGSLCLECIKNQINGGQSMKKVLSTIVIVGMVMGAGSAFAWSDRYFTDGNAYNNQIQHQSMINTDNGVNGLITGTDQDQKGHGSSSSFYMSKGWEGQAQGETTNITISNDFAAHTYDQSVATFGDDNTKNVAVAHGHERQTLNSGIHTSGDGVGTNSVSGMKTSNIANSHSGVHTTFGYSITNTGTEAAYNNSYEYNNNGETSGINQIGYQSGHTNTNTHIYTGNRWADKAHATADVNATQSGETIAYNNSVGTSMMGSGNAYGSVNVSANAVDTWHKPTGVPHANATGEQTQQHSYTQTANNGMGQSQWAAGTVGTYNNAGVYVSD
jgi:hypothetical protein